MKKGLFILTVIISSHFLLTAQDSRVETLNALQKIGYVVDMKNAVFIGNIDGHTVYRTNYITQGRCKGKTKSCKQCPGCCRSGYVDFDETGRIYNVNVDGQKGQLFYNANEDEDYFEEQSQL